ncbi:hypothetical protein N9R79_01945 [Vibrio sp.]|nr:hypothetical protein [Vibrio sp.]
MRFLFFFTFFISGCMTFPEKYSNNTKVEINGGELHFYGEIGDGVVLHAIHLANRSKEPIVKLVIQSTGGSIEGGIHLGYWVYDNNISVVVDRYCFSACANYVLPASRNIHINSDSVIGWHGGATYSKYILPEGLPEDLESFKSYLSDKEKKFYDEIGVDIKITGYPTLPEQVNCMRDEYNGWFYSVESLKLMGVKDIVLEDEYLHGSFFNKKGHLPKMNLCLSKPKF